MDGHLRFGRTFLFVFRNVVDVRAHIVAVNEDIAVTLPRLPVDIAAILDRDEQVGRCNLPEETLYFLHCHDWYGLNKILIKS